MPNGDANREALRTAFTDLAFRSNRLSAWIDFEPYLRNLEQSFGAFRQEVTTAAGPPVRVSPTIMRRVREKWERCKGTDFLDLKSFAEGSIYLSQPFPPDAANPGPTAAAWVASLIDGATQIEDALRRSDIEQLELQSQAFYEKLAGQIADRRNAVRREIRDLCDLTILLKKELEA